MNDVTEILESNGATSESHETTVESPQLSTDTSETETAQTSTTVTPDEILAELKEIEKNQTATIEVLSDIRTQQEQLQTASVYILAVLIIYGVYKFISQAINSCF